MTGYSHRKCKQKDLCGPRIYEIYGGICYEFPGGVPFNGYYSADYEHEIYRDRYLARGE